jgi:hypothetical protein
MSSLEGCREVATSYVRDAAWLSRKEWRRPLLGGREGKHSCIGRLVLGPSTRHMVHSRSSFCAFRNGRWASSLLKAFVKYACAEPDTVTLYDATMRYHVRGNRVIAHLYQRIIVFWEVHCSPTISARPVRSHRAHRPSIRHPSGM